ncbi:hypothetical protein GIB67_042988 [Kingdonia uniflora]|uniref:Transcription elongation factor n=1 Tax=Kingdonia uniflora TaxID=39325 RepID=A0A7J7NTR5_9MAGN|nr:hypothetical protein GIB67_042988 [Kingdonia uniflora]
MDKELLELYETAKKAADAVLANGDEDSPEEARCVEALKQLRKIPVTMKVLVDTQLGKHIKRLSKHPKEKIQAIASDILEIWKGIVLEETAKKKNGSLELKDSVKSIQTVKVEKLTSVKVETVSKIEAFKVEKTVEKSETYRVEKKARVAEKLPMEDKINSDIKKPSEAPISPPKLTSLIKCNDSVRDKIRELLAEALCRVSTEAEKDILDEVNAVDPLRVAVSVESVLFEKMGKSTGPEKNKYRSIMFNIRDSKNPDLRRRLLLGQVKPEKLITMTPEEMASDQRRLETTQIKKKALLECERGAAPKATTDQFRCGRCKQRKCTYYQLQTRSADEPMTTFVTCVNCNNHWKFC